MFKLQVTIISIIIDNIIDNILKIMRYNIEFQPYIFNLIFNLIKNKKIFIFSNIIINGWWINATRSLWRTRRIPYW